MRGVKPFIFLLGLFGLYVGVRYLLGYESVQPATGHTCRAICGLGLLMQSVFGDMVAKLVTGSLWMCLGSLLMYLGVKIDARSESALGWSGWSIQQYFREVVHNYPDGILLLRSSQLNLAVGASIAIWLFINPADETVAWVHSVAFLSVPIIGFIWFVRSHVVASQTIDWMQRMDWLTQLVLALFPWYILLST